MNRTVKLTPEQLREIKNAFRAKNIASKILTDMLMQLSEEAADNEEDMWDAMYEIAKADRETEDLRINYMSGTITVFPKEEDED